MDNPENNQHFNVQILVGGGGSKGPATRNDIVNDIVDDARAESIFATLKKSIVDDPSLTISLRVAWSEELVGLLRTI